MAKPTLARRLIDSLVARPDPIAKFALAYLPSGGVAFDIGAHHGRYTKLFAERARSVYAFEPNPEAFAVLQGVADSLPNVTAVQAALSDHTGQVAFHIDTRPEWSGVASSVNLLQDLAGTNQVRTIEVKTITIDDFCAKQNVVPNLIKIDVEGHEPAVVAGAARVIESHQPALIFEFWETWWNRGYKELFDHLRPLYELIRVQDGSDAYAYYQTNAGTGVVDIAAVPRHSRWHRFSLARR